MGHPLITPTTHLCFRSWICSWVNQNLRRAVIVKWLSCFGKCWWDVEFIAHSLDAKIVWMTLSICAKLVCFLSGHCKHFAYHSLPPYISHMGPRIAYRPPISCLSWGATDGPQNAILKCWLVLMPLLCWCIIKQAFSQSVNQTWMYHSISRSLYCILQWEVHE
jgi:hypothetical protein